MKNYKKNKCYLSLIAIFSLLVTTSLYALESKPLSNEVEFSAQAKNTKLDSQQPVELASDNSYNAQPVVHVEDTSVEESTAVKMRKRREEAEVRTEQKIAENLEKARLADEKSRAKRIFGNKIQPANTQATPDPAVQPLAPQNNSRLNAIENSLSNIKTNLFNQEFDKIEQDSGKYVGLDLGTGKYVIEGSRRNVTTKSAFGISTGMRVEDNPFITLEGHFLFSQHLYDSYRAGQHNDVYEPFSQVNQYNAGLALKYDIIPFIITPRLGASIDYTFRQYSRGNVQNEDVFKKLDTHSIEVALIAGGYIQVSKNLGIEISYRQMMNVSTSARDNRYEPGENGNPTNNGVNLLDRSSYGLFVLSLQMGFQ